MNSITHHEENTVSKNILETPPNAALTLLYLLMGIRYISASTSRISDMLYVLYGWDQRAVIGFIAIGFLTAAIALAVWNPPADIRLYVAALPILAYNLFTVLGLVLQKTPIPAGGDVVTIGFTLLILMYIAVYGTNEVCRNQYHALQSEVAKLKEENAKLKAVNDHVPV